MEFTPNDLIKRFPYDYGNWKFSKNGKGEWVGSKGNLQGVIVNEKTADGSIKPKLDVHKTAVLSSSYGSVAQGVASGLRTKIGFALALAVFGVWLLWSVL